MPLKICASKKGRCKHFKKKFGIYFHFAYIVELAIINSTPLSTVSILFGAPSFYKANSMG